MISIVKKGSRYIFNCRDDNEVKKYNGRIVTAKLDYEVFSNNNLIKVTIDETIQFKAYYNELTKLSKNNILEYF